MKDATKETDMDFDEPKRLTQQSGEALSEATTRKGGQNPKPDSRRPDRPQGQGRIANATIIDQIDQLQMKESENTLEGWASVILGDKGPVSQRRDHYRSPPMRWTKELVTDLYNRTDTFVDQLVDIEFPDDHRIYVEYWQLTSDTVEVTLGERCHGGDTQLYTEAPVDWLVLALNGEEWQHLAINRINRIKAQKLAEQREREAENAQHAEELERKVLARLMKKYKVYKEF